MTQKTTTDVPPTSTSDGWLGRYGLSVFVIIAMPLIYMAFTTIVVGLTPDSRCALCPDMVELAPVDPALEGAEQARAKVENWVKALGASLPQLTGHDLVFDWKRPPDEEGRSALALAADDIKARYAYGVPAALLVLISLPVAFAARSALPRNQWIWRGLWIGGVVVAVSMGLLFQDSNPVRLFAVEYLLGVIALTDYPLITPVTWDLTFKVANSLTVLGMIATASLIVLFSWLAAHQPRTGTALTRGQIIGLSRTFRMALALSSVVLILAVASAYGLLAWAPSLLAPESRGAVESIASSASLYWGVIYSLTLVAVSVPAAMRLQKEIRLCAQDEGGTDPASLARDAGFTFDLRQTISTLMALAGPLLTAPLLDLIKTTPLG